jgi:hypothetical protein
MWIVTAHSVGKKKLLWLLKNQIYCGYVHMKKVNNLSLYNFNKAKQYCNLNYNICMKFHISILHVAATYETNMCFFNAI